MKNMKEQIIDFIIVALREYFREGKNDNHYFHYYGHNFNDKFKSLELNLRDGLYMALVLYLRYGVINSDYTFEQLSKWLETMKTEDKVPNMLFENKNLNWNLYYQLKRLDTIPS